MNSETNQQPARNPDDTKPVYGRFFWWYNHARRVAVFCIGMTVVLIGLIMVVTPGPALVVIPCGLAILATEFVWARKWLDYAKRQLQEVAKKAGVNSEKPDKETSGR